MIGFGGWFTISPSLCCWAAEVTTIQGLFCALQVRKPNCIYSSEVIRLWE